MPIGFTHQIPDYLYLKNTVKNHPVFYGLKARFNIFICLEKPAINPVL
jgi:hypothetical protein